MKNEERFMRTITTATGKKVRFELSVKPGSQVFVAGTFNEWNPTTNRLSDDPDSGHFRTTLQVPTGKQEYKFVVDGVWTSGPKCADWTQNDHGSLNSVLNV
jgi:1,4-alpha-glucan branching enzyme